MIAFDLAPFLLAAQLLLFAVHQADSYAQREWELPPLNLARITPVSFVIGTVVVVVAQLAGLALLLARPASRAVIVTIWGIFGLIVPAFHTWHYLRGDRRFRRFSSVAVVYLTGVVSALLIIAGVD